MVFTTILFSIAYLITRLTSLTLFVDNICISKASKLTKNAQQNSLCVLQALFYVQPQHTDI